MSSRRARGFTLVELLVVIGIIALLISILLPSLNTARRQAATLKCLSNLRQIGNAYAMYANDNKGVWPVALWRPANGRPDIYRYASDAPTSTTSRPWYWHMFIQKYLNSKAGRETVGSTAQLIQDRDYIAKNNILWGCPEWRPWVDTGFTGGINLDEVGYGMNWSPTYRGNFPSTANPDSTTTGLAQDAVPLDSQPAWEHRAYYNMISPNVKPGRFYKQVEWKDAAERGLVCDSEYFSPALDTPPNAAGLPNPQPTHLYQNYGSYNLDFFRHGRTPPNTVATSTVTRGYGFDMSKGKVGTNMLYCDGHAATLTGYKDVYLALRRKY